MSSPFPGMDPYIEFRNLWGDFHGHLIDEIYRVLASALPENYVVRAGERSYVALVETDEEPTKKRAFLPDVTVASTARVARTPRKPKATARAAASHLESRSIMMRALVQEEYREPYLEIYQLDPERKLVTGIEVLSPSNKRPGTKGWRLYRRKRLAYLSGYANFVELDLLRGGRRMPMVSKWPDSPYYLLVCRKPQAPRCAVWPAFMTEPLPPIPIPLAPPDADITLELQPLVEAIYARSRYKHDIDYRKPLDPPLTRDEQAWLEVRFPQEPRPSESR